MPQGTVKSFDPESRAGTVVLDDQTEVPFDTQTFMASGLEELRIGQRVRFELDSDGDEQRVRDLNLVSF
jgi:2-phospho-L-lactate guanylyltransferase